MTDQKPCPRCGCKASGAAAYRFIAVENLRWHQRCWDDEHQQIQDQIEEEAQ